MPPPKRQRFFTGFREGRGMLWAATPETREGWKNVFLPTPEIRGDRKNAFLPLPETRDAPKNHFPATPQTRGWPKNLFPAPSETRACPGKLSPAFPQTRDAPPPPFPARQRNTRRLFVSSCRSVRSRAGVGRRGKQRTRFALHSEMISSIPSSAMPRISRKRKPMNPDGNKTEANHRPRDQQQRPISRVSQRRALP